MRPNSPLRLSAMLMAAGRRVQIARVSEFWIDLIAGGESVFDIGKSGRQAFRVRRFDSPERGVLPSLTFAAFALLAARKDPAVLIIERPADVLHTHRLGDKAPVGR